MLSKLLPVILLIAGTGGGIGAGIMLAPEPEAPPAETAGGGDAGEPAPDPVPEADLTMDPELMEREYIKISNQFVVPVVERDVLSSLVVISLSLEAKKGTSEKIHAYEPKLRDVFLQVLFDHANMGGFRGAFTRSDVLNPLRNALREAAQQQMGKDIYDVLIMEMSRQDV